MVEPSPELGKERDQAVIVGRHAPAPLLFSKSMLVAALFPQSYALGLPARASRRFATPRRAGRALLCAAADDILRSLHTTADAAEEQQRRLARGVRRARLVVVVGRRLARGPPRRRRPGRRRAAHGEGARPRMQAARPRALRPADLADRDPLERRLAVGGDAAPGKESGLHTRPQEQIHELLLQFAQSGRTVVRLEGGDPTVFGRGGEEMEYLEAQGVRVRIVPGVTAAAGIAADLGAPLTHRDFADAVHFLTGHAKSGCTTPWASATSGRSSPTRARRSSCTSGLATLPELAPALIAAGLPADTPAMAVQDGTTASQRVVAAGVGDLADAVAAAEPQIADAHLRRLGRLAPEQARRRHAFGDALTEIKTRAAPVRVLTADGAQALFASVGAREGAADERDSRVEVM